MVISAVLFCVLLFWVCLRFCVGYLELWFVDLGGFDDGLVICWVFDLFGCFGLMFVGLDCLDVGGLCFVTC